VENCMVNLTCGFKKYNRIFTFYKFFTPCKADFFSAVENLMKKMRRITI
jgi:hypothetical protein